VYAVRAGPVLADNLRRATEGRRPRRWRPQRAAMTVLGLGDGRAVAWRGGLSVAGLWVAAWKDWLDARWLARYASGRQASAPRAAGSPVTPGRTDRTPAA
jgi:NADH dehydrogenase FAD-containing subunit